MDIEWCWKRVGSQREERVLRLRLFLTRLSLSKSSPLNVFFDGWSSMPVRCVQHARRVGCGFGYPRERGRSSVGNPSGDSQPCCYPHYHLPRLTRCMKHTVSSGVSGMVPTTWSVRTARGPPGVERPGIAWLRPLEGIESTQR